MSDFVLNTSHVASSFIFTVTPETRKIVPILQMRKIKLSEAKYKLHKLPRIIPNRNVDLFNYRGNALSHLAIYAFLHPNHIAKYIREHSKFLKSMHLPGVPSAFN